MRGREHSFFCNLGLGILLTMKKKLAANDWLIDQLVYRLLRRGERRDRHRGMPAREWV